MKFHKIKLKADNGKNTETNTWNETLALDKQEVGSFLGTQS